MCHEYFTWQVYGALEVIEYLQKNIVLFEFNQTNKTKATMLQKVMIEIIHIFSYNIIFGQ